ncbi:unnamed protein product [Caenorhabditis auriculariae]|uniref:C-type lectin domain-containing protein n=1 Tax=Caenorhabditis auriculariae TaxID=2777116 RepID=A0A8S1HXT8_9PELO|nr:unnamed protein product [Caenorhabditis auriculariae]
MSPIFLLLLAFPAAFCAKTTTVSPPTCPDNTWKLFSRTENRFWCIKYFDGNVNRYDAQSACEKIGATLTGFENQEEFEFLRDTAAREILKFGLKYGGAYWIDGVRTPQCHGYRNINCTAVESFTWSNDYTKGTFAFTKFDNWEPNNSQAHGEDENCLQGLIYLEYPSINGVLNDFACSRAVVNYPLFETSTTRGYFCGQMATVPQSHSEEEKDCSSEERGRHRHHSSEEKRRHRHHSSKEKRRPGKKEWRNSRPVVQPPEIKSFVSIHGYNRKTMLPHVALMTRLNSFAARPLVAILRQSSRNIAVYLLVYLDAQLSTGDFVRAGQTLSED